MTEPPRHALYESRIKKLTTEVEALAARSARIGNSRGIAISNEATAASGVA